MFPLNIKALNVPLNLIDERRAVQAKENFIKTGEYLTDFNFASSLENFTKPIEIIEICPFEIKTKSAEQIKENIKSIILNLDKNNPKVKSK